MGWLTHNGHPAGGSRRAATGPRFVVDGGGRWPQSLASTIDMGRAMGVGYTVMVDAPSLARAHAAPPSADAIAKVVDTIVLLPGSWEEDASVASIVRTARGARNGAGPRHGELHAVVGHGRHVAVVGFYHDRPLLLGTPEGDAKREAAG